MWKALIGSALAAIPVAAPAAAQTVAPCVGVATAGPDAEAVRQMELRGARANVDGWTIEEARAFFDADFVAIWPNGAVNRLDSVLATFSNGRSAGSARSFDLTSLEIRVHGCDSAIVVGTAQVRLRATPADAPAWSIRYLNVWRRQAGQWRLTANQFVRILPAPTATAPANSTPPAAPARP